jgi:preprotein translocase subunit SecE
VARARKSSQRRRANAQPARGRPKPSPSARPTGGAKPPVDAAGRPSVPPPDPVLGGPPVDDRELGGAPVDDGVLGGAPVDDGELGDATVDDVLVDEDAMMAALEPADLPVGAIPIDPPMLPPLSDDDAAGADDDATGEYATSRERLAADRLDVSDEILPAARRAGRPPAKVGGNRVMAFLRASWAELQRVQWPDRRQVGQATAVVLGFVVIAGGFLGLADLLGSDLVNAIL